MAGCIYTYPKNLRRAYASAHHPQRSRETKADTYQRFDIVNGVEGGRDPQSKYQDVRYAVEWKCGEVGLWAVGRTVHTRVEHRVLGEHEGKEVLGSNSDN